MLNENCILNSSRLKSKSENKQIKDNYNADRVQLFHTRNMIWPVVYTYEFTSYQQCEQHVYTVSKCVNFPKLNILLILHSRTLKLHLIFTLLLNNKTLSSPPGHEYYRWIHSTLANHIQNPNKLLGLLHLCNKSVRYFYWFEYSFNFLLEVKSVSLFQ